MVFRIKLQINCYMYQTVDDEYIFTVSKNFFLIMKINNKKVCRGTINVI